MWSREAKAEFAKTDKETVVTTVGVGEETEPWPSEDTDEGGTGLGTKVN